MVIWTGVQTPDPEATGALYIQAKVNGKSVSVFVSAEALQDFGIDACRDVADEKIEAAIRAGQVPERIRVLTSDFRNI